MLLAGFGTGAVLSGFLQGFLLFLAIPIEWSLPFGGLPIFGAVTALALWLYLLHLSVLLGYRVAVVVDERLRPAAHTARANGTATSPISTPPTSAEPGRPKNTACANTDEP